MKTIYDSNGIPVTADDKDAADMIKFCGYTEAPKARRVAAGHPVPDHKAPKPEVKQPNSKPKE